MTEEMRRILVGDCLDIIPNISDLVQSVITSPPYFNLRDYGHSSVWPSVAYKPISSAPEIVVDPENCGLGLENNLESYVGHLVHVFRLVRRILREDGTVWLNLGDSYATPGGHSGQGRNSQRKGRSNVDAQLARKSSISPGLKYKDMMGIPWRVALALQADGWYLRASIPWIKFNGMPEFIPDRPVMTYEMVFILSKNKQYYYDQDSTKVSGKDGHSRIRRATDFWMESVSEIPSIFREWADSLELASRDGGYVDCDDPLAIVRSTVPSKLSSGHFAVFPPKLIEPMILASTRPNDIVLDLFSGTGTVGQVCETSLRRFFGIEINPDFSHVRFPRSEVSS